MYNNDCADHEDQLEGAYLAPTLSQPSGQVNQGEYENAADREDQLEGAYLAPTLSQPSGQANKCDYENTRQQGGFKGPTSGEKTMAGRGKDEAGSGDVDQQAVYEPLVHVYKNTSANLYDNDRK